MDWKKKILREKLQQAGYKTQSTQQIESHHTISSQQLQQLQLDPATEGLASLLACQFHLEVNIELQRLKQAFEKLIRKYPILSSIFVKEQKQYLLKEVGHLNWKVLAQGEELDFFAPIDLAQEAPLKVRVRKLEKYIELTIVIHHVACDEVSWQILLVELSGYYNSMSPINFEIHSYQSLIQPNVPKELEIRSKDYWLKQLEKLPQAESLDIFSSYRNQFRGKERYESGEVRIPFSSNLLKKLKLHAQAIKASPLALLIASMGLLLKKRVQTNVMRLATAVDQRESEESFQRIGNYVVVLPVSIHFGAETLTELTEQVQQNLIGVITHRFISIEEIISALKLKNFGSRHPVFEALVLHRQGKRELKLGDQCYPGQHLSNPYTLFDLIFSLDEAQMALVCEYKRKLVPENLIREMLEDWLMLLTHAEEGIKTSTLLPSQQKALTSKALSFPDTSLLDQLSFLANQYPQATAIEWGNYSLTRQQLSQEIEKMAIYLWSQGVRPADTVAILVERSMILPILMLGCITINAIFLPLDYQLPKKRLLQLLSKAQPKLLVTSSMEWTGHTSLKKLLPYTNYLLVKPRNLSLKLAGLESTEIEEFNQLRQQNPNQPVYIIFTSGTTGEPKGVLVPQRGLNAVLASMQSKLVHSGESKTYLALASAGFDIAVFELLAPLIYGFRLIIAEEEWRKDPAILVKKIKVMKPDIIQATPSLWAELLSNELELAEGVTACCTGEALPREVAAQLFKKRALVVNLYGPTEMSIFATYAQYEAQPRVSIGSPLTTVGALILGAELEVVPRGFLGELYLWGPQLALGYCNESSMTSSRFVAQPYVAEQRMYRTGDLAYQAIHNNEIYYCGRTDTQLSIHGVRVEVEEIEQAILKIPGVQLAAVSVVERSGHSTPSLHAYFVGNVLASQIREQLKLSLPSYMQPISITPLEKMPLSTNGKIDRKQLPPPEENLCERPPETWYEKLVATCFSEVLGISVKHVSDHFFQLGGFSLKIASLLNRIEKKSGIRLTPQHIFDQPEVESLALVLQNFGDQSKVKVSLPSMTPTMERAKVFTLSPGQRRILSAEKLSPVTGLYNMPFLMRITGEIDLTNLKKSFLYLLAKYPILTTCYDDSSLQGKILTWKEVELAWEKSFKSIAKLSAHQLKQTIDAAIYASFALAEDLPIRVLLLSESNGTQYLLVLVHHIVADEWSLTLMFKELAALYDAFMLQNEEKLSLPLAQSPNYFDYLPIFEKTNPVSKDFWRQKLQSVEPSAPPLSRGKRYISERKPEVIYHRLELDESQSRTVEGYESRYQISAFHFLQACIITLSAKFVQRDVTIGMPVHGRDRLEFETVVGYFSNTLPIRVLCDWNFTCKDLLLKTRDEVLDAMVHADMPLEKMLEQSQLPFSVFVDYRKGSLPSISTRFFEAKAVPWLVKLPKFPLIILYTVDNGHHSIELYLSSEYYDAASSELFYFSLKKTIEFFLTQPLSALSKLNYVSVGTEKLDFSYKGYFTCASQPFQFLSQLIRKAFVGYGNKPALSTPAGDLTYQHLLAVISQVGRCLEEKIDKENKEVLIAIYANSRWEQLLLMLAVLYSGKAYVVLDPNYPQSRLQKLLDEAKPDVCLSTVSSFSSASLAVKDRKDLFLDLEAIIWRKETEIYDEGIPPHPQALAYIVFTSGTTGEPKGVAISYAGLCDLVLWFQALLRGQSKVRMLSLANMTFDVGLIEALTPLIAGGHLQFVEDYQKVGTELIIAAKTHQITHLLVTPSILETLGEPGQLDEEVKIWVGAAAISKNLFHQWADRHELINFYGPTEVTVNALSFVAPRYFSEALIPLGKPDYGVHAIVLDESLQPVPIGVVGELYLGGTGLGWGYWKQSAQTSIQFVACPFPALGTRIYRTGDLVSVDVKGRLIFHGRNDEQLKIRGVRVEPAEVQAALLSLAGVKSAWVGISTRGRKSALVAAIATPSSEISLIQSEQYRRQLLELLPSYLVPQYILTVSSFPLTTNGKLDCKVLLERIEEEFLRDLDQKKGPSTLTGLERIVLETVAKVLAIPLEKIERDSSFLALGGDSISALQVVGGLRKSNLYLKPKDLIDTPTLFQIVEILEEEVKAAKNGRLQKGFSSTSEVLDEGSFQPLPVIAEYLLDNPPSRLLAYSVLLKVPTDLEDRLVGLTQGLVTRHSSLRTQYLSRNEIITLSPKHPNVLPQILVLEASTGSLKLHQNKLAQFLDPYHAKNMVLGFFKPQEPSSLAQLLIMIHHLAMDMFSWSILLEDLKSLYNSKNIFQTPISLKKATAVLREAQKRENIAEDNSRIYCSSRLAARQIHPQMNLSRYMVEQTRQYPAELTQKYLEGLAVLNAGSSEPISSETLLIVFLIRAVAKVDSFGPKAVTLDIESHGRSQPDTLGTVGWFTHIQSISCATNIPFEQQITAIAAQLKQDKNCPTHKLKVFQERSEILFNFLGDLRKNLGNGSLAAEGVWELVKDNDALTMVESEELVLRNPITITASLVPDKASTSLQLAFKWSSRFISRIEIKNLIQLFDEEIEKFVSHAEKNLFSLLPLTYTQEGLLQIEEENLPGKKAYLIQLELWIVGRLQLSRLKAAWEKVLLRHPMLRASFYRDEEGYHGKLGPVLKETWQVLEYAGPELDNCSFETWIEQIKTQLLLPFSLEKGGLFRARVIRKNLHEHRLLIQAHHIVSDGWSAPIILRDWFLAYQGKLNSKISNISSVIRQVKALGQQHQVLNQWRRYLRGAVKTQLANAEQDDGNRGELIWQINSDSLRRVEDLCVKHRITVASVLHLIWAQCLMQILKQDVVCFGSVNSGRPSSIDGINEAVALFANTVPLVVSIGEETDLFEKARQICEVFLLATEHPMPLAQLLQLAGSRDLFDSLLVIENYPLDLKTLLTLAPGLEVKQYTASEGTHYPISLIINIEKASVQLKLFYAVTATFKTELKQLPKLYEHYLEKFLATSIRHKKGLLEELPLFNQFKGIPLVGPNLEGIEVCLKPSECQYQLDRLTRRFIALGCQPEKRVVLALPKSVETVLLSMAIWQSGAVLVPLNHEMDNERAQQIIEAIDAYLVIEVHTIVALGLDCDFTALKQEKLEEFTASERLAPLSNYHTAYIIHTSGTTGKPKAISVPWSVVDHLIKWQQRNLNLDSDRVLAHFSPLFFDVFVQEFLTSFMLGCRLVVVPESHRRDMQLLASYLEAHRVDILFATNLVLNELAAVYQRLKLPKLDKLIQSGEKLELSRALSEWIRTEEGPELYNHYGPSETHVSIVCRVQSSTVEGIPCPIGESIGNSKALILNESLKLVERGETGELYLLGPIVANGYISSAALTATRFIANPYPHLGFKRMYRTGDLAFQDEMGRFYCSGRSDEQIKIRGIRIEPKEITDILRGIAGVTDVRLVANREKNATAMLAAVLVDKSSPEGQKITEHGLKTKLAKKLPNYLVPDRIAVVTHFPFTPNNKLDVRQLRNDLSNVAPASTDAGEKLPDLQIELLKSMLQALLKTDQALSEDADFFALGGQSIMATRLVSRINRVFGVNWQLKDIFLLKTIKNMAGYLQGGAKRAIQIPQWKRPKDDIPVGPAQKRFWVLSHLKYLGAAYHVPLTVKLAPKDKLLTSGNLLTQLRESLIQLVYRHEALRTVICVKLNGLYQEVLPMEEVRRRLIAQRKIVQLTGLKGVLRAFHNRPFNLENEVMVRLALVEIISQHSSQASYILAITFHHIACDAWSIPILLEDFATIFEALSKDASFRVQQASCNYIDAIGQQQAFWRLNQLQEEDLSYWKQQLTGLPVPMRLPFDKDRLVEPRFEGETLATSLGNSLGKDILQLARRYSVTPFMVLQATLAILLHRLGCGTDIVLGTPDSGRKDIDATKVVGCFINLLVLRFDLSGNPSFIEVLERVRKVALDAYSHSTLPFETLVSQFSAGGFTSVHPLFTVAIGLIAEDWDFSLKGFSIQPVSYPTRVAKYDLNFDFQLSEVKPELKVVLTYDTQLFQRKTIEAMLKRLEIVIKTVLTNEHTQLADFPILLVKERFCWQKQLRQKLKTTSSLSTLSQFDCIVHGQLAKGFNPKIRIYSSELEMNYGILELRIQFLAQELLFRGIKIGDYVGIKFSRSLGFLASVLAVLRVGAVYVPADKELPEQRFKQMLRKSQAKLFLTDLEFSDEELNNKKVLLSPSGELLAKSYKTHMDLPYLDKNNLNLGAYVIFTSGTTGEPKGVLVTRQGLARQFTSMNQVLGQPQTSGYLALCPFGFDVAMFDILWPLGNNCEIFLVNQQERLEPDRLKTVVDGRQRWLALSTPSFWSLLSSASSLSDKPQVFSGLQAISIGEVLTENLAQTLSTQGVGVWNAYGPSETIIISHLYPYREGIPALGEELSTVYTFLLDEYLQPVPEGVIGEIYIAGGQLAVGYLADSALTASNFVANPFFTGRMYRTGDLAIRRKGKLYFHGRRDQQTKIRGYRVELEEIRRAVVSLAGIAEAVIRLCHSAASIYLVAYIVPQGGVQSADSQTWEHQLRQQLPEYMIPTHWVVLDHIPLNSNGKVDHKSLPEPRVQLAGEKARNKTEQLIAETIASLLQQELPPREVNFISLGMDSIAIILLANQLKRLGYRTATPQAIVENRTIAALAKFLEATGSSSEEASRPKSKKSLNKGVKIEIEGEKLQSVLNRWKNKRRTGD
ncbi:MAG: D-alanine--poly(phosphoribitol) ligase subunit DltA [Neisseriaceae bacterium]